MVNAVNLAQQQSQTTPQVSFGQDGVTVQQPVVSNPRDGVTSGGNQFKVNEYGVILGNVGTGGSILVRQLSSFWIAYTGMERCLHPLMSLRWT